MYAPSYSIQPKLIMTESLRPYYDRDTFDAGYSVLYKPGVGLIDTETGKPLTASLASSLASKVNTKKLFQSTNGGIGIKGFGSNSNNMSSMSDKNYVYDLELQEYFDSNNIIEVFKNLVWSFVKNYCKVIVSQPLEIVRLVLQVGYFPNLDLAAPVAVRRKKLPYSRLLDESVSDSGYTTEEPDEEEEEINYFQSNTNSTHLPKRSPNTTTSPETNSNTNIAPGAGAASSTTLKKTVKSDFKIHPISKHTIDIMSAIVAKDGPFALFRGINASFIYQTLSHTIEAWVTGFMSPFLGIPDPFFLDLTHLTDPWKSLWLSVSACVLTGLILMPLDLIKVRLMLTQFNRPPEVLPTHLVASTESSESSESELESTTNTNNTISRNTPANVRSIRDSIRNYPLTLLINPPSTITCLTILYQFSSTIFRKAAPYILFIRFNVDSYLSPNLYTIVNLLLLILEFFVKLPVENLLRKEQLRFLLKTKSFAEDEKKIVSIENPDEDLIIEFNDGWREEEKDSDIGIFERIKRLGLFDGWRVGVLNVIGFWGYNIFKSSSVDFKEERL